MFEFTYDIVLKDDRRLRGASLKTITQREEKHPEFPGAKIECDLDYVDVVTLSHGASIKVFWDKHVFGKKGNPLLLFKEPRESALVVTCEGQVLICRSDPTTDNRVGLGIYNEQNKVLLIGLADLVELADHKHLFVGTFHEAYPNMRWSPKQCATTSGAVRKPLPPVYQPDAGS